MNLLTVSPHCIRRTQAMLDFFLSPEVTVDDKTRAFLMVDAHLFPEIAIIKSAEGFYSQEYLVQHMEYAFTTKDKPLPFADLAVLIGEEVQYRQKRKITKDVLEAVQDYEKMGAEELIQKISASTNIPMRSKLILDAKGYYVGRSKTSKGFISGVRNLDKLVDGFEYGTITTVGAFSGQYKTTFLLSLLYNSLFLGYNSLFVTLEIPKELLYFRLLSRHSYSPKFITIHKPVSFVDIYKSHLTPEAQDFLFNVVEKDFKELPGKLYLLELFDLPDLTYSVLDSYIRSLSVKTDAVFLDYVQLLAQSKAFGNRDMKEIGNFYVSEMRRLAVSSEGNRRIVFLAAQTNREGYKRAEQNSGRYDLRALSDLNQIEKDSSYVITLYTDDALRASGEIKVSLIKNRFGELTDTPLLSRVDPRYAVIGDEIEGFSEPVSSSEAQDICSTLLE